MGVICSNACEETQKEKNFSRSIYPLHPLHPLLKIKSCISCDILIVRERRGVEFVTGVNKTTRYTPYSDGIIINLSLDVFGFFREFKNTRPFDSLACVKGGSPE